MRIKERKDKGNLTTYALHTNQYPLHDTVLLKLRTKTNWEERQGAVSRSNAATARPLTLVILAETLARD